MYDIYVKIFKLPCLQRLNCGHLQRLKVGNMGRVGKETWDFSWNWRQSSAIIIDIVAKFTNNTNQN